MGDIFKTLENVLGKVVLSKGNYGFQEVIDDFSNAAYVNIVTYNIKTYKGSELLDLLKDIPINVPVNIILNIPKKSFGSSDAYKQIYWYLKTLERNKFNDLNIFFNFSNHAKLVMTDKKAYIGSQNFSDASSEKIELGFIVNDSDSVATIKKGIFDTIKSDSIRYATSDYVIKMEEIQIIMQGVFENLRYNLFTYMGDPPYTPEFETFNIDNAYFPKDEWAKFKELDDNLSRVIREISEEYEFVFNNTKAASLEEDIREHLNSFISELDSFAQYLESYDDRIWNRFYERDDGDTDATMGRVLQELYEEKDAKFSHLNFRGEELLKKFKEIEPKIESVVDLVEEIKVEMLKNTVYENEDKIR